MMKYEVLSSNAWIAGVLLVIFVLKRPKWAAVTFIVLPVMILTVGLALFTGPAFQELHQCAPHRPTGSRHRFQSNFGSRCVRRV